MESWVLPTIGLAFAFLVQAVAVTVIIARLYERSLMNTDELARLRPVVHGHDSKITALLIYAKLEDEITALKKSDGDD